VSSEDDSEIWVDGELAGFTTYVLGSGVISFLHTSSTRGFQEQGLSQELVAAALRSWIWCLNKIGRASASDRGSGPGCPLGAQTPVISR
jgi:GCN5-related N-acetyl-transferase